MNENKKTILVAEDELSLRESLADALRAADFNVITANDGAQALKMALEHRPHLVFLDIMLPHKTGLEVLELLKEDEEGKSIDVIIMTALDSVDKIAEVITKGGSAYIIKNSMELSEIVTLAKEHTRI